MRRKFYAGGTVAALNNEVVTIRGSIKLHLITIAQAGTPVFDINLSGNITLGTESTGISTGGGSYLVLAYGASGDLTIQNSHATLSLNYGIHGEEFVS